MFKAWQHPQLLRTHKGRGAKNERQLQ